MFGRVPPAPITLAYGDGIGPEILEAALAVMREAEAQLSIETIEVGERLYNMDADAGILPSAWETLTRNKVLLQGPVAEPEGKLTLHEELCHRLGLSNNRTESMGNATAEMHWNDDFALFRPAHGTFAEYAGNNNADPSAMMLAAIMMLEHVGQEVAAGRMRRALYLMLTDADELTIPEYVERMEARLWLPLPKEGE